MPNPPSRMALVLRTAGFAGAVALGGVGVWLIVAGGTERLIRLGVLAGLWGLLLGTFAMFGSRRGSHPDVAEATGAVRPDDDTERMQIARIEDAAAQRAYEARLEHMLRHEIQSTVAREVANLRAEIASLRTDLLDKVGGQMQLERIETTRLIGSDLEALQREVRQLRDGGAIAGLHGNGSHTSVEATRVVDVPAPHTDERNRPLARPLPPADLVIDAEVVEDDAGYHGRRRRDDGADDERPSRRGRHSPEGEELLARLLARGSSG